MTLKDVDERSHRDTQLAASLLCTMTLMWDRHGAAACSLMPRGSFREILVYTIKDRGTEALHIYDGIGITLHMYVPVELSYVLRMIYLLVLMPVVIGLSCSGSQKRSDGKF